MKRWGRYSARGYKRKYKRHNVTKWSRCSEKAEVRVQNGSWYHIHRVFPAKEANQCSVTRLRMIESERRCYQEGAARCLCWQLARSVLLHFTQLTLFSAFEVLFYILHLSIEKVYKVVLKQFDFQWKYPF